MKVRHAVLALALPVLGCGSSQTGSVSSAESCSISLPSTCPSSAPSYSTDVAPIVETYCAGCHASGGEEEDLPLTSYATVKSHAGEIQNEVAGCEMPPTDELQPTAAERELLLTWILCGAEND